MAQRCFCCGNQTLFFVWTSSRNFPREKLIKKENIKDKKMIKSISDDGYPCCWACRKELDK